jgi:hypothetical protein
VDKKGGSQVLRPIGDGLGTLCCAFDYVVGFYPAYPAPKFKKYPAYPAFGAQNIPHRNNVLCHITEELTLKVSKIASPLPQCLACPAIAC